MNPSFSQRIIQWQKQHGRHHLPWQVRDPYRVWLSEIMLQQTQVSTVLEYYPRFIATFPDVASLANAPQDEILRLWAGLGYYSRARHLHRAAQQIMQQFHGQFPQQRIELEQLYGVGRSTAAAIAAFAFHQREAILDGNVKRVLCRAFALDGAPNQPAFVQQLWQKAETLLPENPHDMPAYTQGLMDLGATVCKRQPVCAMCPLSDICEAKKHGLTTQLPRKKITATVQGMSLFWLIIRRDDGAIYLLKRPNKGIWGNLYCCPCFDSVEAYTKFIQQFDFNEENIIKQNTFTHRLTHRILEITPFEYHLHSKTHFRLPEEQQAQWVLPHELSQFGLPKPLQHYLGQ